MADVHSQTEGKPKLASQVNGTNLQQRAVYLGPYSLALASAFLMSGSHCTLSVYYRSHLHLECPRLELANFVASRIYASC
jgi:hypothetical protein